MTRPTIREVARHAGVSISTVSHTLSGHRPVGSETAARVFEAIEELGYRPNRIAASLVMGKTRTLGLVVPDIANPFFAALVRAVEYAAINHGYTTVACSSERNAFLEDQYLDLLIDQQVDGVVYVGDPRRVRHRLERLDERGTAVVLLDRIDNEVAGRWVSVSADSAAGGALVAAHLLDLGHRRFGIVAGPRELVTSEDRLTGFRLRVGNDESVSVVNARDFMLEEGIEAVELLLSRSSEITALFCENDLIALGAIRVAHQRGIRVPDDLSIVGYDDIFVSCLVTPSLTTIRQPVEELGVAAVNAAVGLTERTEPAPASVLLEVELVRRESSGAAPRQCVLQSKAQPNR